MNFQVFGCPNCEQPFQVSAAQAGQVVQCPSCAQQVEIPKETFEIAQQPESPPVESQQIFACPTCSGQFGITSEMVGQQVGCPHCQSSILIQLPDPDPETLPPEIVTDRSISKGTKKKKPPRKSRAKNPGPSQDLFAPGFKKPKAPKADPATKQDKPPVDKPPVDKSQQPAKSQIPDPPAPVDPGSEKEKQRWRSTKKTPPKSNPAAKPKSTSQPTGKPKQQPAKSKQETVAPKPLKQKSKAPPAKNDGSKTKRLAFDATVELDEHPDDIIASRSAITKPDVVATEIVEATAVETPPTQDEPPESPSESAPAPESAAPKLESGAQLVDAVVGVESGAQLVDAVVGVESEAAEPDANEVAIDTSQPDPIDHLLPPRFDVLDPSQLGTKTGETQFKVLLPDGKGGMAQLDRRIVSVEHAGERVSLVVMTPEQKKRRRLIQNIIAIIIGIAIMWIAFSILT